MPQRILVVDDELDTLMLLRVMIEGSTDYEVETTSNGFEALKILKGKDIDLIISDLSMPGLNGLELFDEVKNIRPDIPIIIVTAYGSLEIADEAMKKGVADFITKPFRKDNILFTINRVLELARVQRENIEQKQEMEPHG